MRFPGAGAFEFREESIPFWNANEVSVRVKPTIKKYSLANTDKYSKSGVKAGSWEYTSGEESVVEVSRWGGSHKELGKSCEIRSCSIVSCKKKGSQ